MKAKLMKNNLPPKWNQVNLGKVGSVLTGGTPRTGTPEYWGGSILWMSSGEVNQRRVYDTEKRITEAGLKSSNATLLPKGAVMVALAGQGKTRGKVAVLEVESTCNQSLAAIIPNTDELTSDFLFYSLERRYQELRNISGGEGRAGLNLRLIKEVQIQLPPLAEQKKIAEILRVVDDEITKIEEIISTTEKLRIGLLQKLFSKGIGHKSFKTTKFGKIPTAWMLLTLGDIIQSLDAGVSVNSENRHKGEGEIGVLKTSAVTFGIFDPLEHKTVLNKEKQRVRVPVKKDRIILSRMNTLALVGANAYVEKTYDDLYLPDRLWQIEPKDDSRISMKWLSYILGSMWGKGIFSELASGTSASMKNLSKDKILALKIALPPLDEQQEIVDILNSVDNKIAIHKRIKSNLLLLKKGLMQDLLTGKVRTI